MKEYSKVIYDKNYTIRKGVVYDLLVDDVWVNSSNSLDNIRAELFESILNRLYEVSLGQVVLRLEIIECYYKTELFISCFKQELES